MAMANFVTKLIETYPGFGPELTTDGNMEDDPTTNWPGTNANVAEETTAVHAGCMAIEVTATANNGYVAQSETVEAGERYKIEAWGERSAAGHQWRLRIYIAGSVVWTGDWHNNATYEKETKFYRVPDGITTIQLRLEIETDTEVVYFDDVSVRREPPVPMTEIDLMFRATDDWAILDRGLAINDPMIKEIWGGELETELVRREEGKRVIPMQLEIERSTANQLIDSVNALEEMLRHAARYRKDGWGGEVFLEFKLGAATHGVWYPVIVGQIDKGALMKVCCRETKMDRVPVVIICEAYWEAPVTYDLENLLDNPGFEEWNDGICDSEPDCWTDKESLAAGTGTNQQETDTVEEGCEALRIEVTGINNGDFKGVYQDIQARLRADTEYTLLVWVQNAAITNGVIWVRVEGSAAGTLCSALNSGAANDNYTQYSCQFTPPAADIAGWVRVEAFIQGSVNGCSGIAHIDKLLVMEASNVPMGWWSSSYLWDHYDRGANHINWISACDIPGEVDAEVKYTIALDEQASYLRMAKRTRDTPCSFIWQLIPCEAYTRWETGANGGCQDGFTDVTTLIVDSDKVGDGSSPSGSNITVDFATTTGMARRCYWDISTDLLSYYGKFGIVVLAYAQNATDTITMEIRAEDSDQFIIQGNIITQTILTSLGAWPVHDGWEVFSYRIGARDDALLDTGNYWRISLYAETDAPGAPATDLLIAGLYIIPLDEAYLIGGRELFDFGAGIRPMIIKQMDGDRGIFAHSTTMDIYYSNIGMVGQVAKLTPGIENRLYFIATDAGDEVTIADKFKVSVKYRPRGIFMRGTNP